MPETLLQVSPRVLAAALAELEEAVPDPSSSEWEQESARIVQRLLSDEATAQRLVEAVERHGTAQWDAVASTLPARYGPARMASRTVPRQQLELTPPVGSQEFDDFVDASATGASDATVALTGQSAAALATPAQLGFSVEFAEPPAPPAELDALLRDVQHQLERLTKQQQHKRTFTTFWARLTAARDAFMRSEPLHSEVRCRVRASNYFVVQAKVGAAQLDWASITSGENLFVELTQGGHIVFRDQLPLHEHARAQRALTQALATWPDVGVLAVHELRRSMVREARAAFATGVGRTGAPG